MFFFCKEIITFRIKSDKYFYVIFLRILIFFYTFHKNVKQHNWFKQFTIYWAANQHIRIVSEGSCDTEDWSNAYIFQI